MAFNWTDYASLIPMRAFFGRKHATCKVLLVLILTSIISLTVIRTESLMRLVHTKRSSVGRKPLEKDKRNDEEHHPLRGYTSYTIRRLGLRPLSQEPLEPSIGTVVVNDVLSFKYPIELGESKCPRWMNRTWADLISAYDDDMSVNRTLLIAVVSAADNFAKRETIRQTWGNAENLNADWLQLVFLVGSPDDANVKQRDKVQELLKKESNKHKDIVQVDVTDSYDKLTLKSVSLLNWALSRCPGAQLVLKCDDDTYINFETLIELLGEDQFAYTDRIYGVGIFDNKPQRKQANKYFISREVWPWSKYPTFLSGGAYILGKDSMRPLLAAAQTTPLFPLEDVYLTGLCARKANIPFLSSQRIYERFVPKRLNPCFVRTTAMWQTQARLTIAESHDVTKRIYAKRLDCRSSCKYLGVC